MKNEKKKRSVVQPPRKFFWCIVHVIYGSATLYFIGKFQVFFRFQKGDRGLVDERMRKKGKKKEKEKDKQKRTFDAMSIRLIIVQSNVLSFLSR
jgi:hypothetical protein